MASLFVLGGARSGKSRYAQARAEAWGTQLVYIATAQAFDDEMAERIAQHRADRGPQWSTLEAPLDLPAALDACSGAGQVVLVDCLTLWVSNLILADQSVEQACTDLLAALTKTSAQVILVSNEVGLGIVPDNALARRFRDEAGRVNQRVAAQAREVQFLAAGLNLALKLPQPILDL